MGVIPESAITGCEASAQLWGSYGASDNAMCATHAQTAWTSFAVYESYCSSFSASIFGSVSTCASLKSAYSYVCTSLQVCNGNGRRLQSSITQEQIEQCQTAATEYRNMPAVADGTCAAAAANIKMAIPSLATVCPSLTADIFAGVSGCASLATAYG